MDCVAKIIKIVIYAAIGALIAFYLFLIITPPVGYAIYYSVDQSLGAQIMLTTGLLSSHFLLLAGILLSPSLYKNYTKLQQEMKSLTDSTNLQMTTALSQDNVDAV